MSGRWHIVQEGAGVTLCRHLPPRFDIAVHTTLPAARPLRLAHQIRQDLWRALARVRGFSPVVRLTPTPEGWAVTAGGRAEGRVPVSILVRAEAVLAAPRNRTRWLQNAKVAP